MQPWAFPGAVEGVFPARIRRAPGVSPMLIGSTWETHRGITVPTPLPRRGLPAGTENCSTVITIVIGVRYMAASSSVSWLLLLSCIAPHYQRILPQSLATAKSRDAPKYWPVRACPARFLKSDLLPWVGQAIAWPVPRQRQDSTRLNRNSIKPSAV